MPLAEGTLDDNLVKTPILTDEEIVDLSRRLFSGLKFAQRQTNTSHGFETQRLF
jgi:hypothetical protein